MLSTKLKWIRIIQKGLLFLPVLVFLSILFQFNIDVRANQVTLWVDNGVVEVKNPASKDFTEIKSRYLNVASNTDIRTQQGTAYIVLPGKSIIALDTYSSLSVNTLSNRSLTVTSDYGRTWHKIYHDNADKTFAYTLKTPTAQVSTVQTEFEVTVAKEEKVVSKFKLLQGQVVVTNKQSKVNQTISEGKQAKIKEGENAVYIEDAKNDQSESEFTKKNQIVKAKIKELEPNSPIESYKSALEQASITIVKGLSGSDLKQGTGSIGSINSNPGFEKTQPNSSSQINGSSSSSTTPSQSANGTPTATTGDPAGNTQVTTGEPKGGSNSSNNNDSSGNNSGNNGGIGSENNNGGSGLGQDIGNGIGTGKTDTEPGQSNTQQTRNQSTSNDQEDPTTSDTMINDSEEDSAF